MSDFIINNGVLTKYRGPGGDVVIPEGVTAIGWMAFCGCKSLTSVTIPAGVASIGDLAFDGCENLTSVMLPDSLTSVGYSAFSGCVNLTGVTIPDSVTSIENDAFKGCVGLQDKQGFVIMRGVLYDCVKKDAVSVTIPDGVTTIGGFAFWGCKSLTSVAIPEGVTTIGKYAFYDCSSLRSVTIPEGVTSIGEHAFGEHTGLRCSPAVLAHSVLFEPAWLRDKQIIWDNAGAVAENVTVMLQDKTAGAKQGNAAVKFVLGHLPDISAQSMQSLAAALKEKKCTAALKKLQADPVATAKLEGGKAVPKNPTEALVLEHWVNDKTVEKFLTVECELKYAGSEETCSKEVIAFVIAAYVRQAVAKKGRLPISQYERGYLPIEKDETADRVAAALDREGLLDLLERLTYDLDRPECAVALGRYADEAQVAKLLSMMRQWENWQRYARTGRECIMIARGALMLNDTRAAMLHMEKAGQLEAYARLRGTDADTLRDTVLADFGFNADGKKRYDLGNKTVTASIGRDLTVALYDETAGKAVKSLPKKGADPEKYAAANDDLADLKKNVKKVAKTRNDRLFGDFLSGNAYEADKWQKVYLGNPVLRRVAELLVWSQDKATFTLGPAGPIQSDGMAYAITDAPIAVAHPMETDPADVAAWQNYFVANGLKQPFEQVWEPVVDPVTIRPERYEGQKVSVFRFMHREKHGIELCDEDYYSTLSVDLAGCQLETERTTPYRHMIGPDETFTLGKFSFKQYDRRVNHIVALLDRWTVAGRILKDDVSVREVLDGFTAAQIMEYIRLASENHCPNCAAMLLAYKQEHYPDFDPMAEFTLE